MRRSCASLRRPALWGKKDDFWVPKFVIMSAQESECDDQMNLNPGFGDPRRDRNLESLNHMFVHYVL